MENLEIYLSLGGTIIGLIITVLTFFIKSGKNARARRSAEQAICLGNAILPLILEVEKFSAFSGVEKKAYVMTHAQQFALDNKIAFIKENVEAKIEELVALTRQVNCDKKNAEDIGVKNVETNVNQAMTAKSWL